MEARNHSLSEESRGNFQATLDYRRENMRLHEAFADLKRSLSAEYAGAINKDVKHSLVNAIDRALEGDKE